MAKAGARRRSGVPVLALVALAAAGEAAPAMAATYLTQSQALAEAFPGARIARRPFALTPGQARAVEERARVRLPSRLVTAYSAWRGDTLAGTAFFDSRVVRTMPGVFMVIVAPDTTVARIEVLAFHEPADYRPTGRWLEGFAHRRLDERLWPARDLRNLAGATLSARAVTESARLALALYETVVVPAPAGSPPGREGR